MAIDLNLLFSRLGKLGKLLYLVNGDQAAYAAMFGEVAGQYAATLQDRYGQLATQQASLVRGQSGIVAAVQQLARQTVLGMVEADSPAAAGSLATALGEVRRQMLAAGETVKLAAVGLTIAALGTPAGSGVWVATAKRGDGLAAELMVAETGRLTCTADSYSDGATAGRERFLYTGEPDGGAGVFDYDYPQGSAAQTQLTAVSADDDANSAGNLLTNGDFENWSADATPVLAGYNWATTGTAGTDFAKNPTSPFRGAADFRFKAGGVINTALAQTFNDSTGTSARLIPQTSYAVNLWAKRAGTVSAGVLTVELVDGTGTVINDPQGTANSFTQTCSALTTSYAAVNGVFRTPAVVPAGAKLRLRMSTALTGADVLLDDVCLTPVTRLYTGGPGAAVFAGAVPFQRGDTWTVVGTNDRGGASYLATFQSLTDRFFQTRQSGFLLPSASSSTISDSLITA